MPKPYNKTGRSTTERFVQLHHYMLNSTAWLSLTPAARVVFIELRRLYDGSNNGRIGLSVRKAADRCCIAKETASRAFEELQQKGFIDCVTPGAFSRKIRHASEWRLNDLKCDASSREASRDFMRWDPEKQNTVPSNLATVPNQGHSTAINTKKAA